MSKAKAGLMALTWAIRNAKEMGEQWVNEICGEPFGPDRFLGYRG